MNPNSLPNLAAKFHAIFLGVLFALTYRAGANFRTAPPIPTGGALQTSNVNSYAAGPLITELGRSDDFTIEGWVYIPQTAFNGLPGFLVFQEELALVEIKRSILGNQIEISFGVATGTPKQFSGQTFVRSWAEYENAWHYIACVNDAHNRTNHIYFDGIITVPGFLQTTTFGNAPASLDKTLIGGAYDDRAFAWGFYWDEVHVSKGIRYAVNFTPPKQPFVPDAQTVALWHFDEAEGATQFADASGHGHDLASVNGAQTVPLVLAARPRLDLDRTSNGQLELRLTGQLGHRYRIEASTDLVGWALFQEFQLTGDSQSFNVPLADTTPAGFFRAREVSPVP